MRQNKRNSHKPDKHDRRNKPAKPRNKKRNKGEQPRKVGSEQTTQATDTPATAGQFDDRISNPFRHWEPAERSNNRTKTKNGKPAEANPDIEGMWVAACERRLMRFGNVPIVSRVDSISGSEGTRRPLYVLSSSTRMLGEKRDSSLDAFGMRTFASPMMLQPIGANNKMPEAAEDSSITVYTDASHKGSSVGISAMFDPDDGGAYAYAGTLLIDTDLDGLINASESIAAISAVLAAIEMGYRRIRVMSDSSELIRMWNREMSPRRTVMRQLTVLHDIVDRNGIEVIMQHVYGHRSDFMNVAADGIAQVHERMSLESPVTGAAPEPAAQEAKSQRETHKYRGTGKQEQKERPTKKRKARRLQQDAPTTTPAEVTNAAPAPADQTPDKTVSEPPKGSTRRRCDRKKAQVSAGDRQVSPKLKLTDNSDAATSNATPADTPPEPDISQEDARKSPNKETANLANALHETEPKITLAKVSRCLNRETYLNWPRVNAESGELIRSLMCDDDRRLPIDEIDSIWDAVAPNIAKSLEPRRRKHRTVIRAAVIARICAVSLKKTIDATRGLSLDTPE